MEKAIKSLIQNAWNFVKSLFVQEEGVDFLLLFIAALINIIVLANAIIHHPEMGYDAPQHLKLIEIYPEAFPTPDDSYEYFSPPLPYILPSLVNEFCISSLNLGESPFSCSDLYGKFAQLVNFILSLGITIFMLGHIDLLVPNQRLPKIIALALLSVLTVFYKIFAFVRGEPYVVFFSLVASYYIIKIIYSNDSVKWIQGVLSGIALGCMMLSRQWGVFIFPAIGILFLGLIKIKPKDVGNKFFALVISILIAFAVSSWFYLHLYFDYGSLTAYSVDKLEFSFLNVPRSFFRNTALSGGLLFRSPTRLTFDYSFFPIYYSETWGDYWGYLVFIREKSYAGQIGLGNLDHIGPYLGRVNLVSLYPSAILAIGLIKSGIDGLFGIFESRPDKQKFVLINLFFVSIIIFSLLGHVWFLITYPVMGGRAIKSGYMLHIFIFWIILCAIQFNEILIERPHLKKAILVSLGLVFIHNLPAMISRYPFWSLRF
jgi:hypothetical protein